MDRNGRRRQPHNHSRNIQRAVPVPSRSGKHQQQGCGDENCITSKPSVKQVQRVLFKVKKTLLKAHMHVTTIDCIVSMRQVPANLKDLKPI